MYQRIKELREAKGMSQQDLAEKVGFKTASAVNKIELGLRDINQTKIKAFAEALNTTSCYLLDGEESKKTVQSIFKISEHEEKLIIAYRSNKDMQKSVDKLLGLDFSESEYDVPRKIAARGGGVETRALSDAEKEAIINQTYAEDL